MLKRLAVVVAALGAFGLFGVPIAVAEKTKEVAEVQTIKKGGSPEVWENYAILKGVRKDFSLEELDKFGPPPPPPRPKRPKEFANTPFDRGFEELGPVVVVNGSPFKANAPCGGVVSVELRAKPSIEEPWLLIWRHGMLVEFQPVYTRAAKVEVPEVPCMTFGVSALTTEGLSRNVVTVRVAPFGEFELAPVLYVNGSETKANVSCGGTVEVALKSQVRGEPGEFAEPWLLVWRYGSLVEFALVEEAQAVVEVPFAAGMKYTVSAFTEEGPSANFVTVRVGYLGEVSKMHEMPKTLPEMKSFEMESIRAHPGKLGEVGEPGVFER